MPFLSPGDLPDSGIKLESPTLAGRLFTTESQEGIPSYILSAGTLSSSHWESTSISLALEPGFLVPLLGP